MLIVLFLESMRGLQCVIHILVVIDTTFIVLPLHNAEFTPIFLNKITNAISFNSNLCNDDPLTYIEFKDSVGNKLLLRLSVPSSFLTVSALFRCIIGVSSKNFLVAIEFIKSQSNF